jgi:large subunit ribosomal protein L10
VRDPRPEKVAVVDEVGSRLAGSVATLLTEYRGLPVKDLEVLRRAVREAGGEYKIYKNSLVRRAVEAGGHEGIDDLLVGPTGMVFVDGDVVAVAKALRDFARTNPFLIVKGGLVGSDILDARRAAALAELPSKEVLLAQIAGLLAAPMQRLAGLLQALPQNLAYALKALIEQRGGVPVEETAEETVAEAAAPEAATPEAAEAAVAEEEASAPEAAAGEVAVTEAAAPETAVPDEAVAEAEVSAPEAPAEPAVAEDETSAPEAAASAEVATAAPVDSAESADAPESDGGEATSEDSA